MRGVLALSLMVVVLALAGCAKTDVTESDINGLSKQNSQAGYEDAMKKAGRGAELEAQKKIAAERGQGDR